MYWKKFLNTTKGKIILFIGFIVIAITIYNLFSPQKNIISECRNIDGTTVCVNCEISGFESFCYTAGCSYIEIQMAKIFNYPEYYGDRKSGCFIKHTKISD